MKEIEKWIYSVLFVVYLFQYIVPEYEIYVWTWFVSIEFFCVATHHLILDDTFKKLVLTFGVMTNIVHMFMPVVLVNNGNLVLFKTFIFCLGCLKIHIVFY